MGLTGGSQSKSLHTSQQFTSSTGSDLGLGSSSHLLHPVLLFLLLLSAGLGLGLQDTLSDESVLRFELLGRVHGVVDEGEAGALAAAKVGLEAEGEDTVRGHFEHLGQLLANLSFGD